MATSNMDERWDEIAALIDQAAHIRSSRRSPQAEGGPSNSDILAAWREVKMGFISSAIEPKLPTTVGYGLAAQRRRKGLQ